MGIPYRLYTISDEEGDEIVFKHFPNQNGRVETIKDTIHASLHARKDLISLIETASRFMDDNTISKVEIEEDED